MNIPGQDRPFIVIGENVHTTRVLSRKGKLIGNNPDGIESIRFRNAENKRRFLTIPEEVKKTQDYEEGRVKHLKIAVQQAMQGSSDALAYISRQVQRQEQAGTYFLDLNVDEISYRIEEQQEAMRWLVGAVHQMSQKPLSIDSSKTEILHAGLAACTDHAQRPLLNSASLERLDGLDLAKEFNAQVVITAAGKSGMPQNTAERMEHATLMVEAAQQRDIPLSDLYIDPLIFPIAVDGQFGNHAFETIRQLRAKFGAEVHITGGFSNVSFGLPCRRLINDVFLLLAIEAGADSAIIDPTATALAKVFVLDRHTLPYQLAEDMLLGKDDFCANFIGAYRKGDLH
jgi:5-methyltetrahydrofolate--homocysteine methyltransferase